MPRTHIKSGGAVANFYNPRTGEVDRQIDPWSWLVSQASLFGERQVNETPYHKKKVYMHIHTRMCTFTYIYT